MGIYGTGTAPKTELLVNGTWTDFSSKPRAEQKIVINRGRANEQSYVTAQSCATSLNNRDGILSNRNPLSQYFGLLPRNTQFRVTAGAGDNYLKAVWTDDTTITNVSTADKAVLDVTGDIDVRCEVQPYSWRPPYDMVMMSKYQVTSNQRSWAFYLNNDGHLSFIWSTDGTAANRITAKSTAVIPFASGRLAVRVTLDVNNGASGNTATFYTATAVGGTYTQLGSPVVTAGVTSIFSSSADLVAAGGADDLQVALTNSTAFGGRFFKGELWNGLGSTTRVANMDATSRSVGDTTWSDGLATPNTWTITAGHGCRITTDRLRFWGELSSLPQVWDLTGRDVYVPVTASGLIRRLTQGASPLSSPMYRNFNQYSPAGYWALEDGSVATTAASSVSGGTPAATTAVAFGASSSGLPGAASVAQFTDSTSSMTFTCPKVTATGTISVVFYVNLSALPATGTKVLARINTTGVAKQVAISLTATTWNIEFFDSAGTSLAIGSTGIGAGIDPSQNWVGYNLLIQTSGGNSTFSIRWDTVSGFGGGVGPTVITAGSVGIPLNMVINSVADAAYIDAKLAQVFFSTRALDLTNDSFRKASSAWLGETACARLTRLAAEEGEPIEVWGIASDSEVMGFQLIDTFMNNVYDCIDTDGGIGGECRDALSLFYRSRASLEGRSDVVLDYAQSHLAAVPLPTEDDQAFTNDVTVSRPDGTSARVQNTDGATSISDPPAGVGRYVTAVTRNVGLEAELPNVAGWMVLVGSWDDARYPTLAIGMHRTELTGNTSLTAQVISLELGDTAILRNLPVWLPPDDVPELVQGYRETLDKLTWTINVNASPAGPYLAVSQLGSDANPIRLDATTHSTGGSLTTTAASVSFVTPAGSAVWVDSAGYPAEFPFTVKIDGEAITVTAITGTASPQTASLTRSVNGIVKTHLFGALVRLAKPYFIGR